VIPDIDKPGFPFMEGWHKRVRVSLQGEVAQTCQGFPSEGGDIRHRQVKVSLQGGVIPDTDYPGLPFRKGGNTTQSKTQTD
jgi:hypothetical protein